MRPGYDGCRFHGEINLLQEADSEEGALPHFDMLWHYDCVVKPRSPSASLSSHVAKLRDGNFSPRSPLHASGLLSPHSPVSPHSPSPVESSHDSCPISVRASSGGAFAASTINPSPENGSMARCATVNESTPAPQHRHELQRVFSTFDEDGDALVGAGELCSIFQKLGIPKSKESIECLLAFSSSSSIDQKEFFLLYDLVCAYVDELDSHATSSSDNIQADVDQDLRAAFHVFDLDGDGFISPAELQLVLCTLGFEEARQLEACVDMIARVDENGDGHVDFSEFKKLMGLVSPALIQSC